MGPELLRGVRRLFVRTTFSWLKRRLAELGIERCKPGAVVAVQRSGSAMDLNVHLHALFLDPAYVTGEFGEPLRWQTSPT